MCIKVTYSITTYTRICIADYRTINDYLLDTSSFFYLKDDFIHVKLDFNTKAQFSEIAVRVSVK